jgi:hypothetical protein
MDSFARQRRGLLAYFRNHDTTVDFSKKLNAYGVRDFCTSIEKFRLTGKDRLTVDFSRVLHVSPGGMLPVICTLDMLRDDGVQVEVKLPRNAQVRSMFEYVRWENFLTGNTGHGHPAWVGKHSVVRRFEDTNQQRLAADVIMEIIIKNMDAPRSILSGAEWVFYEITNNVLNHSGSKFGGLVQVSIHPGERAIAFAIADSGRGMLGSMREGFPRMRADLQAIGEAIKPGVSRVPKVHNGLGLARALGIALHTGGAFEITSGRGKLMAAANTETKRKSLEPVYGGTAVCGYLKASRNFSLSGALSFNDVLAKPKADKGIYQTG